MGNWELGIGNWELGIGDKVDKVDFTSILNAQCPMPHAPCPMPHAPCPMPHAPCPITQFLTYQLNQELRVKGW
ncbi:hypothetical protein [Nostoc sp. CMAA1605]|uniref:hypothetical protein n=1 Tax=Nostoc sp. CMAA1605 TaxID=2055159 RepID=UPI001F23AAE1|nr:hypothetical protein [Nostoc sp. CMAA1605]